MGQSNSIQNFEEDAPPLLFFLFCSFGLCKGRTIRKVMGGVGKKPKKNSCKGKCPKKKFMQGKMSEKKIHAQDGPHFDMKP